MEDKKWCVYKHTNKINGKCYIGITCKKNPNYRWSNGIGYKPNIKKKENNTVFYNAILKYGWDNFEHEILEDGLTLKEANLKESHYIKLYNSFIKFKNPNGYNMTLGGEGTFGHKISKESKEKISNANKGIHKRGNSGKAKRVFCDGVIYDCVEDCANKLEISRDTLGSYLRRERVVPKYLMDMKLNYADEDFKENKIPKPIGRAKTIIYNGMEYNKLKDLSNELKIKPHIITKSIKEYGTVLEDKILLQSIYIPHQNTKRANTKTRPVICDGVKYISVLECCKVYEVKKSTMLKWLTGINNMPEYFINKNLRYEDDYNRIYKKKKIANKKIIYGGEEFNSIKALAEKLNIPATTLSGYLNGKRTTPQWFKSFEFCE